MFHLFVQYVHMFEVCIISALSFFTSFALSQLPMLAPGRLSSTDAHHLVGKNILFMRIVVCCALRYILFFYYLYFFPLSMSCEGQYIAKQ